MELVVDANILVAGFLRSALTRELLVDERLTLYTPEYGLEETEAVLARPRFRKKLGGLSLTDVRFILTNLTAKIRVLPTRIYAAQLSHAARLSPDPGDIPYLATAMHLHVWLWSNDADLKNQRAVPVYTTEELLELLPSD